MKESEFGFSSLANPKARARVKRGSLVKESECGFNSLANPKAKARVKRGAPCERAII